MTVQGPTARLERAELDRATATSWLRVRHDVLADNLRAIRAAIGPDRALLLPVKADAYGHGAVAVATRVEAAGLADWFGVATAPEGIELREAGIRSPILKFTPTPRPWLGAALDAGLTLAVAGDDDADAIEEAAASADRVADVHLKVDTGMGRVGVPPGEAAGLAARIERTRPHVRTSGVFTHFAASDTPLQDDGTRAQIAAFGAAVAGIEEAIGRPVGLVHAANSGATLAHPDAWLSMVRPGILSYGYLPDGLTPPTIPVRPALEWYARVSFVKPVAAGTTIGYGRTWTAPHDTWIATIPVGYADGFDRRLSNRGRVLAGGRVRPIVGRVCMDQAMFDVGPSGDVAVGDEVALLGGTGADAYSAADMARELGTIPYEVCSTIGPRIARVDAG